MITFAIVQALNNLNFLNTLNFPNFPNTPNTLNTLNTPNSPNTLPPPKRAYNCPASTILTTRSVRRSVPSASYSFISEAPKVQAKAW